jgi:hypothetical protein
LTVEFYYERDRGVGEDFLMLRGDRASDRVHRS